MRTRILFLFIALALIANCTSMTPRLKHQPYLILRGYYPWIALDLYRTIEQKATEHGVDPFLMCAIIQVESRGRNVVSRVNKNGTRDYGYCQINSVHRPDDPGALLDPTRNIDMGCRFLKYCFSRGGNVYEAVRMYNAGPNSKWSRNHRYVARVLDHYRLSQEETNGREDNNRG